MVEWTTSQDKLALQITTPLGKDVLLLDQLRGSEQLSSPFEFHLQLHSSSSDIDLKGLVGQEVQVSFTDSSGKRYFCGIVGQASHGATPPKGKNIEKTVYELRIYPAFWLLKFTRDHRIFQNQSAVDIIKVVFQENNLIKFKDQTTSRGRDVREYCVQYGETAFNFVSRLLEEEGICYFFEHTAEGHTMILADANSAFIKYPEDDIEPLKDLSGGVPPGTLIGCMLNHQVVAKTFAACDYNYDLSSKPMLATVSGEGVGGEIYHYPGIFSKNDQGSSLVTLRIEELEWDKESLVGQSTAQITAGYKFTIKDHPAPLINKAYVAYRVEHEINIQTTSAPVYRNNFLAFDAAINFRPPMITPKPRIYGTQTAVVTGKSGEEIWTDKYGRVAVQFHWDRKGAYDETSSLMIRVAQGWAMSGWGMVFTPRIGQEVVVSFIDGDPDRPLITGCVYNTTNLPPYLPDEPTKSTVRSNTSKGGGGFNEIRLEDKKDSEQIFLHAQKDFDRVVENDRTLLINQGNDTETIQQGNRIITLAAGGSDPANHELTLVKGDNKITLKEGNFTIVLNKGDTSLTIDQGNLKITLSQGDVTEEITGKGTITFSDALAIKAKTISLKADQGITIEAGTDIAMKSGTALNIESGTSLAVKAGLDGQISATTMLQLKGTLSAMVDGGPMLQLKSSAMVQIQGGAMVQIQGGMVQAGSILKVNGMLMA